MVMKMLMTLFIAENLFFFYKFSVNWSFAFINILQNWGRHWADHRRRADIKVDQNLFLAYFCDANVSRFEIFCDAGVSRLGQNFYLAYFCDVGVNELGQHLCLAYLWTDWKHLYEPKIELVGRCKNSLHDLFRSPHFSTFSPLLFKATSPPSHTDSCFPN